MIRKNLLVRIAVYCFLYVSLLSFVNSVVFYYFLCAFKKRNCAKTPNYYTTNKVNSFCQNSNRIDILFDVNQEKSK